MSEMSRRGVLRSAASGFVVTTVGTGVASGLEPPRSADIDPARPATATVTTPTPEGEGNELVVLGVGRPNANANELKKKIEQTALEMKVKRTGIDVKSLRDSVLATPTKLTRMQYEAYDDMLTNRPAPSVSTRDKSAVVLVPFERATTNGWLLDLGGTYKLKQVEVVTVDDRGESAGKITFTPEGAKGTKLAKYLDSPGEYELELEPGRRVKSYAGVKYDSLKRTSENFEGENRRDNSFWYIHVKGIEPGEVKVLFDLLSAPNRTNPIRGLKRTVSKMFVQAALDTIPELGTTTVVGNQVSIRVNRLSKRSLDPEVYEESVLVVFPLTKEKALQLAREANKLNDESALAGKITNRVEPNDKDFLLRPGAEARAIVLPPSADAFAFERILTTDDAAGWRARAETEFWRVVLLLARNKVTEDEIVIRVEDPNANGVGGGQDPLLAIAEPDNGWLVGMTDKSRAGASIAPSTSRAETPLDPGR